MMTWREMWETLLAILQWVVLLAAVLAIVGGPVVIAWVVAGWVKGKRKD